MDIVCMTSSCQAVHLLTMCVQYNESFYPLSTTSWSLCKEESHAIRQLLFDLSCHMKMKEEEEGVQFFTTRTFSGNV